jgi:hypothetical protein
MTDTIQNEFESADGQVHAIDVTLAQRIYDHVNDIISADGEGNPVYRSLLAAMLIGRAAVENPNTSLDEVAGDVIARARLLLHTSTDGPILPELDALPSDEAQAKYDAWVARSAPEIAAAATLYPQYTDGKPLCWRSTERPDHHFLLYSFQIADDGEVLGMLVHGRDSSLPGAGAYGQPLKQLIRCGCGQWQWATREQIKETRERIIKIGNEAVAAG